MYLSGVLVSSTLLPVISWHTILHAFIHALRLSAMSFCYIIGASLSEPHISQLTLQFDAVCLFGMNVLTNVRRKFLFSKMRSLGWITCMQHIYMHSAV